MCVWKRVYAAMNEWSASGIRPATIPTIQATSTTKLTATLQSSHQMISGIARIQRKKTVRRFRARSSVTTRWIGWGFGASSAGMVSDTTGSLRSGAGKHRWALLQEGPDSFPEVCRRDRRLLELGLERELLLE